MRLLTFIIIIWTFNTSMVVLRWRRRAAVFVIVIIIIIYLFLRPMAARHTSSNIHRNL